jgi:hypothetical protein
MESENLTDPPWQGSLGNDSDIAICADSTDTEMSSASSTEARDQNFHATAILTMPQSYETQDKPASSLRSSTQLDQLASVPFLDAEAIDTPQLTNSGATTPLEARTHTESQPTVPTIQFALRMPGNQIATQVTAPKIRIPRSSSRASPYPSPKEILCCERCGKVFRGARNLRRHRETTACGGVLKKLFKCTCGDFARPRKDQVKQHIEGHRGKSTELVHQLKESD